MQTSILQQADWMANDPGNLGSSTTRGDEEFEQKTEKTKYLPNEAEAHGGGKPGGVPSSVCDSAAARN